MKILQVTHVFKPLWESGGIARVAYEISKRLMEQGHELTIYTTNRSLYKTNLETNKTVYLDGMKVYYFENLRKYFPRKSSPLPPVPYYLPFIARKEVHDFDVIHIHGYRTLLAVIVHHYAQKYGVPYVLQAHGSVATFFQKGRLKKIFDTIWGYRILKDAAKVIAVTKIEAEQYKSMGVSKDKIEIVPNGIDLSEFDNLPQRGEFRRKYGLNDNQRIILYLGRIHRTKGLDLLTKAFSDITEKLDDAKLVIVGPDDGYLSALKQLIKELNIEENVLFTGPLYGREKLNAYVDADVLVNPHVDEIFGLVFLEACACGTPVICSSGCGIADVIGGQAGLVVPYDKDQLRDALLYMLGDDKMRQQFGEKGKLLVCEKFDWKKIAEQVESIYKDIL